MFENMENLKIRYTLHRKNKPFVKIENRKIHSFFIRTGGSVLCDFYNKKILVNSGDILFIPKGTSYTVTSLSVNTKYTSINFEADFIKVPEPVCYPLQNFAEASYITNSFHDMWSLGNAAEKYQCFSHFYSLLAYLSNIESSSNIESKKYKLIEPAVTYLKEHIYDSSLKAEKLHRLCGISNTYFRQIFFLNFNKTPQSYIISKRISHAKEIITSGDFSTIEEVALSVGFADPLYFSKVFKKFYGIAPSQIGKN